MNQIVSDYYEAQKKKIPFGKAVIAEAAITNFKGARQPHPLQVARARLQCRHPKSLPGYLHQMVFATR